MTITYTPDYVYRNGRLKVSYSSWGECYSVSCPFCSDTRGRLTISHRWGVRDAKTRDDMLHLANCFNEECLSTRERQKELHAMLFPEGWHGETVNVPIPIKAGSPARPPSESIVLPKMVPLNRLPSGHRACRYLRRRGFDLDRLTHDYGLGYCEQSFACEPRISDRVVIPIYRPAVRIVRAGTDVGGDVRLVGWQARAVGDDLAADAPKYLTSTGTRKSTLLYGLPLAIKTSGPAVIVEGVADVWKVGPNAVAILGKAISDDQLRLAVRHFRGRPVIVWLDIDAGAEADTVVQRLRRARAEARDVASPVLLARTPEGRKDPGDCTSTEVSREIERAISRGAG